MLNRWVLSFLRKLLSDSAVRTTARSSFHHCGARTENSWDSAERCLPVLSEGGPSRLAEVIEQSTGAGAWGLTNYNDSNYGGFIPIGTALCEPSWDPSRNMRCVFVKNFLHYLILSLIQRGSISDSDNKTEQKSLHSIANHSHSNEENLALFVMGCDPGSFCCCCLCCCCCCCF